MLLLKWTFSCMRSFHLLYHSRSYVLLMPKMFKWLLSGLYQVQWMMHGIRFCVVSHARLSYPKRERESGEAVLGSCTARPSLIIWLHYVLTNSYVLWSTVCIPNHTIIQTTWAPAAQLCCLWPRVGLYIVWVYSANTAPPLLDNEHSSSTTG